MYLRNPFSKPSITSSLASCMRWWEREDQAKKRRISILGQVSPVLTWMNGLQHRCFRVITVPAEVSKPPRFVKPPIVTKVRRSVNPRKVSLPCISARRHRTDIPRAIWIRIGIQPAGRCKPNDLQPLGMSLVARRWAKVEYTLAGGS